MAVLGMQMDFSELVGEARRIEKQAVEKKPYSGEIVISKSMDFSPEEYVDKSYRDLVNDYERLVKIMKFSGIAPRGISVPVIQPETQAVPKPPSLMKPVKIAAAARPAPQVQEKKEKIIVQPPKPSRAEEEPEFEFEKPGGEEKAPEEKELRKAREGRPAPEIQELEFEHEQPAEEEGKKKGEEKAPEEKKTPEEEIKPMAREEAPEEEKEEEKKEEEEKPQEEQAPEEEKPAEEEEKKEEEEQIPEQEEIKPISEISQALPEEKEELPAAPEPEELKKPALPEEKEKPGEISEESFTPRPFAVPPLLAMVPEKAAEEKYSELESKIPSVPEKMNEKDLKKRMIELTRELFKEKSTTRKEKIKADITNIRNMLSRKAELPQRRAVSYATSFLNAMEVDQHAELSLAKDSIVTQYRAQLTKALEAFSAALVAAKDDEEKKAAYDALEASLGSIKASVESLTQKYESFFLREHTAELQKLLSVASLKNDKYVTEKINERTGEIKFVYASEFLALGEAVRKEIASTLSSRKHQAIEARKTDEMEKVLSITNMSEEELIKYAHANHKDKYYEFERGAITKLELIVIARILMAKDSGLRKETINKYFGSI